MSTIVTRAGKGSALTHNEVDANFTNLNTDKLQSGNTAAALTITSATIAGGTINGTTVGATTPAAGTFTSLTDSGNLTFTGTGNRITGDYTNATIANRTLFQTSTANSSSFIGVIPSGTGTTSAFIARNSSDPDNASSTTLQTTATQSVLVAGRNGTGSFLPLSFYTNSIEQIRIETSGNVGIGTTAPLAVLNVNGADGELIRISVTPDAGVIQEPALGFATGVTNTHPAAKISALEFDASDSRASLLFYTRGSNSDIAPTLRMTIGSDGLVELASTSGLAIGRTAVTSPAATDGNVFSGTYTPTLTNSTNVAASSPVECFYTRVGNVVTVAGQVSIDVTTTLTDSVLLMTLPVASTFTVTRNCGGTGASSTGGTYGTETIAISANVANDAAEFRLRPTSVANLDYRFSFSYRVL